jgi:hypothetical protein
MNSKWIKLTCSLSLLEILDALLKHPISEKNNYGFDTSYIDEDMLNCSFYEKDIEIQTFTLPNGEIIQNEVLKIVFFEFFIYPVSTDISLLCIKAPPRTLKGFIQRLTDALSSVIFVSNITFDVLAFITAIRSLDDTSQCVINEISVTNLIFDESNSGEIKIKSRVNALEILESKFAGLKYSSKNAKFTFRRNGEKIQVRVSKSGLVEAPSKFIESLPSIVSKII